MPQQTAVSAENNFINGVVTEATALNFPDKAVVEAFDCIFDIDGSVYRRTGFDLETNFATKTIDRSQRAIKTYLWQNVAGNGTATVAVVQIGNKLYFYEADGTGVFSTGAQTTTITLTPVSGAPVTDTIEAQFCDGNGFLIVTHPYIDPIRVSYDLAAHVATSNTIVVSTRDFVGDQADPYAVDFRFTGTLGTVDVHHLYNLYNQGWTTTNLTTWDTAQSTIPSNSDVMWNFKDTADNFSAASADIARIITGNTPAPHGKFIYPLSFQNRAAAVAGANNSDTSFQRPAVCAFFSGRVFYSGVNYIGYNSNIYFSQIIENVSQYGNCYQVNDPTSEELFDELPSDGGVIAIPEAGTIYKLFTVPGGLCIFAANGVWFITGSTGLGFTATDYSLQKVADVSTISDTSFVNIMGFPAWWNSEGIYIIQAGQTLPTVKSLTYDTFKTFYDSIPVSSKRYARGFFDKTDGQVRWIYRSESTNDLSETYEYDRVLNYNFRTNAFYPWTISDSAVKVHAILSSELVTRPINLNLVVDSGGNFVVDSSGNSVISFSASGSDDQQFDKYLVSYANAGSYNFSFADRTDDDYSDWASYEPVPVFYNSYFITGFKLNGQAIRKFQSNWVETFSRLLEPVKYRFQALWDFATTGDGTGRWSTNQIVEHTDLNYNNARRRLKTRGHGLALQFRISSVDDKPFDIIGWSSMQTLNGAP